MTPKLTLDALAVLDAIDRRGSFSAAANALYRVPSAISYTVQKLEEDLNVSLFRKAGRRHVLTPAGQHLLDEGRTLLAASDQIIESTQAVDRGVEPNLNIAINTVYRTEKFLPHLQALSDQFPNMNINLTEETLGGTWEAIEEGRVDLVIGDSERPKSSKGIRSRPMPPIEWVFAVSPDHPLTQASTLINTALIQQYRAIVVQDSSRHNLPLTRRVLSRQTQLRVTTMQQKIDAQRAGLGVGYLPKHLVQEQLESGQLITMTLVEPIQSTPMNLLWRQPDGGPSCGKGLNWFVRYLSQENILMSLY